MLVVGGEAGVGKTWFLRALAEEATAAGILVASGACQHMDAGAMPYAPLIAAIREVVRQGDPGTVAATLGGDRREIARLVPDVARVAAPAANADAAPAANAAVVRAQAAGPAGPSVQRALQAAPVAPAVQPDAPHEPAPDPFGRLRLFEAVTGWLERFTTRRALLLVIEDLQWADAATLDLVRAIASASASMHLLVVVSFRTDELPSRPVQLTIAELDRDGAGRIELAPFDAGELAGLAAALGFDLPGEAIDRLLERTGGNPFLAVALLEAGVAGSPGTGGSAYLDLPPSLRDILDARLAALDADTLRVMRAAAIDPGPVDDAALGDALQQPLGRMGEAIREATLAGVLTSDGGIGGGTRFRHALLRDVLVAQLGPGERRDLHRRLADALARASAAGSADGSVDPARASSIAFHRDEAGDPAAALSAHETALGAAERAFAFDAAQRHARRAATLLSGFGPSAQDHRPDVVELLERGSLAALLAGDAAGSATLAREALPLARADPERAARLHDRVRWALWQAGEHEGARRELEMARAEVGDRAPAATRARLVAQLAATHLEGAEPATALDLAERAIGLARSAGARDVEALALGVRGRALAARGDVDGGLRDLRAAVQIAVELNSLQGVVVGRGAIAAVLTRSARDLDALSEIEGALETATRLGLGRSLGSALVAEAARSCFALGRWDEAERRIDEALGKSPPSVAEARLRIVGLRLAAARAAMDDAATHERRLTALRSSLADPEDLAALDLALAELALARGRPDDVRPLVDRALGVVAGGVAAGPSLAWLAVLGIRAEVEIAVRARSASDEARDTEACARLEAIATVTERETAGVRAAWGPRAEALLAQVEAERSRVEGPASGRVTAWERAVRAWQAIQRPYLVACAQWRLAEAAVAAGRPRAEIAAPLVAAAETLRDLRAGSVLGQVERLGRLVRIDLHRPQPGFERVAPDDPLATLALTPREREVLRLVALGWSNRRIAEALAIAPKTASVHVSNILGKLDVENRVEAAAIAHRLGVVELGEAE